MSYVKYFPWPMKSCNFNKVNIKHVWFKLVIVNYDFFVNVNCLGLVTVRRCSILRPGRLPRSGISSNSSYKKRTNNGIKYWNTINKVICVFHTKHTSLSSNSIVSFLSCLDFLLELGFVIDLSSKSENTGKFVFFLESTTLLSCNDESNVLFNFLSRTVEGFDDDCFIGSGFILLFVLSSIFWTSFLFFLLKGWITGMSLSTSSINLPDLPSMARLNFDGEFGNVRGVRLLFFITYVYQIKAIE